MSTEERVAKILSDYDCTISGPGAEKAGAAIAAAINAAVAEAERRYDHAMAIQLASQRRRLDALPGEGD